MYLAHHELESDFIIIIIVVIIITIIIIIIIIIISIIIIIIIIVIIVVIIIIIISIIIIIVIILLLIVIIINIDVFLYRGWGANRAEGGLFGSSPGHLDHDTLDYASQCSSGSQWEAAVQLSGSWGA